MTEGPTTPRLPCKHCREPANLHADGKCLFQPTSYEPIPAEHTRAWFGMKLNGPSYDYDYDRKETGLLFDQGYAFAWESEGPNDVLGRWTNCGRYRSKTEREELEQDAKRPDGVERIIAERGPPNPYSTFL